MLFYFLNFWMLSTIIYDVYLIFTIKILFRDWIFVGSRVLEQLTIEISF